MARFSKTEQLGVHAVATIVLDELNWIFREQPIADMGIDAHIEHVDEDGNPTGLLIAAQIKTGASHFHETADAYVYYGDLAHLAYWSGHALPVILIAHLPETDDTFWVSIERTTVQRTPKHWKVAIPKAQRLGMASRGELEQAFEGTPREQKLRRLAIDEPLMRFIQAGGRVSVELEDWYNKSLGRSTVQVIVYDEKGEESVEKEWFAFFIARDMKEVAEMLFPWAVARVDEEFYEENSESEETERDILLRAMDADNGIAPYQPDPDVVYPYSDNNGEVAAYRLRLSLNELGRAYLLVSDHLDDPGPARPPEL